MTRVPMSAAAAGLLRALLARVEADRDRILLSEIRSVDWQSLTFAGERHAIRFRIAGPDAEGLLDRFADGLADVEFAIPGQIVADVAIAGAADRNADGSITVEVEALTIAE